MKVCLICEAYPPHIFGGAEICAELLAESLARKGLEVHVLTPNYGSYKREIKSLGNLSIHRYPSLRSILYRKKEYSHTMYKRSEAMHALILNQALKVFEIEMAKEIRKLLKMTRFDVLHANNYESTFALSRVKTKIPKVSHFRDLPMVSLDCRTYDKKFSGDTYKAMIKYYDTNAFLARLIVADISRPRLKKARKMDYFISINNYLEKQLAVEGFRREKIQVINDPIDPKVISQLKKGDARKKLGIDGKILLYVGTLSNRKGAHLLPGIAKGLPEWRMIIAGDGPLRQAIEEGNIPNMQYIGKIEPILLRDYYRASDLFLSIATVDFGFGKTSVEAMANGLPVASFNIQGMDELIDDMRNGILVVKRNEEGLIAAIESLKRSQLDRMGKNCARDVAAKFDSNKIADQVANFYNRIIS